MKWFCLLAPIGALLGLVFSAKTSTEWIFIPASSGDQVAPDKWHLSGCLGWILFGIGVAASVFSKTGKSKGRAVACAAAAAMIFIAAVLIGWIGIAGRLRINAIDSGDATVNPVWFQNQMEFLNWVFVAALSLMIAGGLLMTFATLGSQLHERIRPSWIGVVAVVLSLLLITVSVFWSGSSVGKLNQEWTQSGGTPDPKILFQATLSNFYSMLPLSLGVLGCSVALGATAFKNYQVSPRNRSQPET